MGLNPTVEESAVRVATIFDLVENGKAHDFAGVVLRDGTDKGGRLRRDARLTFRERQNASDLARYLIDLNTLGINYNLRYYPVKSGHHIDVAVEKTSEMDKFFQLVVSRMANPDRREILNERKAA